MDEKEMIKDHYNKLVNRSVKQRQFMRNINIRNYNNYIKSCLITKYVKRRSKVLDIGIGKGGDFQKYRTAEISELYGIDIANRSILDAIIRAIGSNYKFKMTLKTRDGYSEHLDLKKTFDIVSIQFSFHYAFVNERTLNTSIGNISRHLNPGGYLLLTMVSKNEVLNRLFIENDIDKDSKYRDEESRITVNNTDKEINSTNNRNVIENSFYKIEFIDNLDKESLISKIYGNRYYFSLVDSINCCVEYLVDFNELVKKVTDSGFELVENLPFEPFFQNEMPKNIELLNKIKIPNLTQEELEVVSLYQVIVFRKIQ